MNFLELFNAYNQPLYGNQLSSFTDTSSLNAYNQALDNYLTNTNLQFYSTVNQTSNTTSNNYLNNYASSIKNHANGYLNLFYRHYYPNLVNYAIKKIHLKTKNDCDSETEEVDENLNEQNEKFKRHCSLENLFENAKEKIKNNKFTRSKSIDARVTNTDKFENFGTTSYNLKLSPSYDLNDYQATEITTKNILLPEVTINNVRYNRPDLILQNLKSYMSKDGNDLND